MTTSAPDLHRSPPIALRRIGKRVPWLLVGVAALAVALGVLAAIDGSRLLVWDRPITDAAIEHRSPGVDRVALWVSRLGSTPVVLTAGVAGVAVAALRCRTVALVMFLVLATRPPFEWLAKEVVARPRPSGARLVTGTGFSYPAGHVLAAAATWGFVPVIAGLYVRRRRVWVALTLAAWSVIVLVAWSRVWLGVHWTSDVVGSLAVAFVALTSAETAIHRRHRSSPRPPHPVRPAAPEGDGEPPQNTA
jgi:undecaprenyl-diphosphatase